MHLILLRTFCAGSASLWKIYKNSIDHILSHWHWHCQWPWQWQWQWLGDCGKLATFGVDCLRKQMFPCSCQLADNLYGQCFMCQLQQFVAQFRSGLCSYIAICLQSCHIIGHNWFQPALVSKPGERERERDASLAKRPNERLRAFAALCPRLDTL